MTSVQFKNSSTVCAENLIGVKSIKNQAGDDLVQVLKSLVQRVNDLEMYVHNLSGLVDVDVSDVKDGDVLSWDSNSRKWVSASLE
jgi:hypothetical protein